MQAWLTLRLKELLFSVGGLFLGVHRHEHPSVQPSPASHDSPNVQFGITLVGISAADDVLFRHQIRIRAQLRPQRSSFLSWRVRKGRQAVCSQYQQRTCPTSSCYCDGKGFTPAQQLSPRSAGPEWNSGQREHPPVGLRSVPQARPHPGVKDSRWQAFCLHMRHINPHSGCHLYSLIGLWCPLNQSV